MIRIHKENPCIKTGSIKMLSWQKNLLAYGRFEGDEKIIVIVNNGDKLREVTVPVWMAEVPMEGYMDRLMYTYENGYTIEPDIFIVDKGEVVLNMGSHSAVVMRYKNK